MVEQDSNLGEKKSTFKKYLIIAIILIVIVGLVLGISYFVKEGKCNKRLRESGNIAFYQIKCISECPLDSKESYDSCSNICNENAKNKLIEKGLTQPIDETCTKAVISTMESLKKDSLLLLNAELAKCAFISITSIRAHLNDSSVAVETSCINEIEQKYSEILLA